MIDLLNQPEANEGLNPVAVEIVRRVVKGLEPFWPQWAEGLLIPVTDIGLAWATYFDLWSMAAEKLAPEKREAEQKLIAELRLQIRSLLAPHDGGLLRLSNATST